MESSVPDFILFLGRFHPLVVHLPIGFLIFAFMFELYGRWKRDSTVSVGIEFALLAGALSAAVACVLGYMLSLSGDYEQAMLDTHFWFGIATTLVTFFAWSIRSGKLNIPKLSGLKPNMAGLTLVVVLVGITGHYGGNLTHGSDYLVKYAPFGRKEKVVLPPIDKLEDAAVYDYLVNPILDAKCTSCHNSSKKKGGLSLQDSMAITKGGKNGEAFIAGDVAKSEMMRRVMLNPHHEDYMPPEGKTPLTDEEKSILSFWIEKANADFRVTMGELETPEEIISIASNILGLEDVTGKSGIPLPKVGLVNEEILKDIAGAGFKVRELIFESGLYEAVLPPHFIDSKNGDDLDGKLEKLLPMKDNIIWLSLKDNGVQDRHLKTIGQFVNLQKVELEKNPITDMGIAEITGIQSITGLNLYQTKITASSFDNFIKMKGLERVYAWGTAITEEEVARFAEKQNRPAIIMGM
ncbi:c-type cytochrome domain-containing protein [Arenibacter palladensis]|uniref:c-type cytochrome domain-containing protein n=1 Tax=Arenibacter palladensis TaxID=237373 RepID=UPI002FD401CC